MPDDRTTRLVGVVTVLLVAGSGEMACFSERPSDPASPGDVCQSLVDAAGAKPGDVVVRIRGFAFAATETRVPRGASVLWVNCDTTAHTSTSDAASAQAWSSPLLSYGQSYRRVFDTPGSFPYHCEPHPDMKATLVVQ